MADEIRAVPVIGVATDPGEYIQPFPIPSGREHSGVDRVPLDLPEVSVVDDDASVPT